jgi:hypothetical protein
MSCIKTDIIQKYIDGEISSIEIALIEKHIADCKKCAAEVEHQRLLSLSIKKAINLLAKDKKEIPAFDAPEGRFKKRFVTTRRIIYSISVACVLFVVLMVAHKKKPKIQEQLTIFNSFGSYFDANLPITQQKMVIRVIDSNGKITEY